MANKGTGYGRRWKKWLAIYAVAGVIIYLAFFSSGGGGATGGGGLVLIEPEDARRLLPQASPG